MRFISIILMPNLLLSFQGGDITRLVWPTFVGIKYSECQVVRSDSKGL